MLDSVFNTVFINPGIYIINYFALVLMCSHERCWHYLYSGLLVGCSKKVKFRGIFRDKFAEKMANFMEILPEFSRPVLLKNDWFCADLRNVFIETRCS